VLTHAPIALCCALVCISANRASYDDEPAAKPAPAPPAAQNASEPVQAQPAPEPVNDASANAAEVAQPGQDEIKQEVKEDTTGDAYMGGGGWNGPGPSRGGGGGDDGYGPINVKEDG
jgi:hypothetical protein